MSKGGGKYFTVESGGPSIYVAHVADRDGQYLSLPVQGPCPLAAMHQLLRRVCRRCWTRDRKTGEKFCGPCGMAFIKSIQKHLQPIGFCKHRRDPWCVAPYWDEGESPMWHNVEAAYEDDWEPERLC